MNKISKVQESGQSLVFMAILMFVFLAILALVLDGGMTYFHRRNAQNAADAAALAAADFWCKGGDSGQAEDIGEAYATVQNMADTATVTVPSGTVEDAEIRVVQADTAITFNTFFGSILGRPDITTVARAKAGCYPPAGLRGVLPVAWSCAPPTLGDETWDLEDCELLYGNEEIPYDGQIYIIMDIGKLEDDIWCQDPVTHEPPEFVDCDIDDDQINDLLGGGQRSWLDLDSDSSNANELTNWVSGDEVANLRTHVWLRATNGGDTSVYMAAAEKVGQDVVLPVFNHYCETNPASVPLESTSCYQNFDDPEGDPGGDPVYGDTGSTRYDHVVSFVVFHITCVSAPSVTPPGGCPAKSAAVDEGLIDRNEKTIEGYFVRGYTPGAGGGPNDNPWVGAFTVYLIE